MIRPSRVIILGAVLVIGAACSGATPTTPETSNTMAPDAGALMTESSDTTCRGGFTVANGKTC
jgi:hypothetical protein